jgi:xanthine dehydrogenase small subunit
MPLLMALGAQVRLMRWDETTQQPVARELPLEAFFLGYRKTALTPTEVLTHILVPPPQAAWQPPEHPRATAISTAPTATATATATAETTAHGQWLRVYKISKRFEDDISAVCLGLQLTLDHGTVTAARLGVGGVAATPVRAHQTEAALTGQPWTADTVARAAAVLSAEFAPISDMRASAAYRRQVLGGLLRRTWLESQGHHTINLEHASREHLVGASA